ncbi:MAG TPA: archaellin/type IV pilin N-terminal domain-containing protein [Thermoplasmata archaeon]|nr:archaellin/type IV pilin N-terminal domain-containing protein [Thermoplasmata archaeon]
MRRPVTRRRGASPIIATLFLIGITITAGVTLWSFRVQLPSSTIHIWYQTVSPNTMHPYGDGSDCIDVGSGANKTQICQSLPGIDIVVTNFEPSHLPLASLQFYFLCDGTVYLSGSLSEMAWVPGDPRTIGAGNGTTPTLGNCGTYTPPSAAFNRFMYFQQLTPSDPNLEAGDQLVISAQSFAPPYCAFAPSTLNVCWVTAAENAAIQADSKLKLPVTSYCPVPAYAPGANPAANGSYGLNQCDDDYHGVPTSSCYTVPGACEIDVAYTVNPPSLALRISMLNLFTPAT